jgi:MATE family multidrug resistance protein
MIEWWRHGHLRAIAVRLRPHFLPLSLPSSLARTGLLLLVLSDIAAVARIGTFELAAFALGLAPFTVLQLVATGLLSGTHVLASHARGAGRRGESWSLWQAATLAALALGSLAVLLPWTTAPLLRLFGQSPGLAAAAVPVATSLAPGLPALLVFVVTQFWLEAQGRAGPGLAIVCAAVPANLLLDFAGLFGTDAAAVAWSTTVVRLVMAAAAIACASALRPAGAPLRSPQDTLRSLRQLFRLGLPWAVSQGLETLAFHALVLFAGTLGVAALSSCHIAACLLAFVYTFTVGTGAATAIEVGRALGAGDPRRAARAGPEGVGTDLAVMGIFAAIVACRPHAVAGLFTDDPAVVGALATCMPVLALVFLLDGLMGVLTAILRGFRDLWRTTLLHALGFRGLLVPAAAVATLSGHGLHALFWALALGLAGLDLLLAARLGTLLRRSRPRGPRRRRMPAAPLPPPLTLAREGAT